MSENIIRLFASTGYAACFFFVLIALFANAFFLWDEGTTLIGFGNKNMGWLHLLVIPLELAVMLIFFIVMIGYL